MILRNGKHLRPPNCYSCNKFFGNSDWNWRCSVCSGNGIAAKLSPFYNEEYQTKLKAYVNEKTTDSVNNLLKYALQNNNIIIAAQILQFALKKTINILLPNLLQHYCEVVEEMNLKNLI